MENESLRNKNNDLRKIKMMLKKTALLGVDIYTSRRDIDRLTQLNESEFNLLAI